MTAVRHFSQGVPGLTRDLVPQGAMRRAGPRGAPGQARGAEALEGPAA